MINLIGILILVVIEAILIMALISYFSNKLNNKDEEIAERDKVLGERTQLIREKNMIIKEQNALIEDLKNENRELERKCNTRLQKNN